PLPPPYRARPHAGALRARSRREHREPPPRGREVGDQGSSSRTARAAGFLLPDQDARPTRPAPARRGRAGRPDDALRVGTELETSLCDGPAADHISGVGILLAAGRAPRPAGPHAVLGAVLRPDGGHVSGDRRPVRGGAGP